MSWIIYTRGTIPTYRVSLFLQGLKDGNLKEKDYDYLKLLVSNEGKKLWFAYGEKEALEYGDILMQKILTKKSFEKHYEKLKKIADCSIEISQAVDRKNLAKLNNEELSKIFIKAWKIFIPANTYLGFDIDIIDIVFEKFLYKEFGKEFKGEAKDKQDIFHEISTPSCKTYVQKEETTLLRIALKNEITSEDITKIYDNFWWTSLGWESIIPKSKEYFEKQIAELQLKDRKILQENLRHLENHAEEILSLRKKLFKKYKLSQKFAHLLNVADRYTFLHDLRKEMQVKNVHSGQNFLKEIARRTGYKMSDLEWLWADEILELLVDKKLDKKLVKKRKICYFALINNRKFKETIGENGIKLRKKELETKLDNSGIIKGQIGQRGKIRGIVRVCNGAEDALRKIKTGDILVCGMTLPEYVPAMKKAGAIITDEGGITCHAAIISRELKIPCVTGTKIATQVLKDGDSVEVDANKGVVKILK